MSTKKKVWIGIAAFILVGALITGLTEDDEGTDTRADAADADTSDAADDTPAPDEDDDRDKFDDIELMEEFVGQAADDLWVVLSGDHSAEALDAFDDTVEEYWDSDEWPRMADVEEYSWNRTRGGDSTQMDGADLARVAFDLEDYGAYYVFRVREGDVAEIPGAEADASAALEAAQEYARM